MLLCKFPVYNDRLRSWFKLKERNARDWKVRSTKVDAGDFKHELLNRLKSTMAVNVLINRGESFEFHKKLLLLWRELLTRGYQYIRVRGLLLVVLLSVTRVNSSYYRYFLSRSVVAAQYVRLHWRCNFILGMEWRYYSELQGVTVSCFLDWKCYGKTKS